TICRGFCQRLRNALALTLNQNIGEDRMNRLMLPAIVVAASLVSGGAFAAQASEQPGSGFQPHAYFEMPLEKDPNRQVRLQNVVIPPGAANKFHRHPGDQWWAVQEGEVQFQIKGQPPRTLHPGDWVYVPRGTIHRNMNMSDK